MKKRNDEAEQPRPSGGASGNAAPHLPGVHSGAAQQQQANSTKTEKTGRRSEIDRDQRILQLAKAGVKQVYNPVVFFISASCRGNPDLAKLPARATEGIWMDLFVNATGYNQQNVISIHNESAGGINKAILVSCSSRSW